jgi:hypothetical protein
MARFCWICFLRSCSFHSSRNLWRSYSTCGTMFLCCRNVSFPLPLQANNVGTHIRTTQREGRLREPIPTTKRQRGLLFYSCSLEPPVSLNEGTIRICKKQRRDQRQMKSVAKFWVPDCGEIVYSGIELSYRPARLHRMAGWYDNTLPESTVSPQ